MTSTHEAVQNPVISLPQAEIFLTIRADGSREYVTSSSGCGHVIYDSLIHNWDMCSTLLAMEEKGYTSNLYAAHNNEFGGTDYITVAGGPKKPLWDTTITSSHELRSAMEYDANHYDSFLRDQELALNAANKVERFFNDNIFTEDFIRDNPDLGMLAGEASFVIHTLYQAIGAKTKNAKDA